jgi:hypothetical protein
MTHLERRLVRLERAPAASRVVYRAYHTTAEAEADTEEPSAGETLIRIITSVPRAPASDTDMPTP